MLRFLARILAIFSSVTFTCGMANDEALKAVAKSNTDFTSALYQALSRTHEGNLIFSPFSLSVVAAMINSGARGQTAKDIQTTLKFPSSDDTLNQGYSTLLNSLKSAGENFTLETANKIYIQQGFNINSEFTSNLQKYYNTEATQLNFAESVAAATEINTFVEKTTHDKIKDLVLPSDFNGLTRLFLVNSIYFKGLWKKQFKSKLTHEADFHLNSNEKVKVQMMNLETTLPYAEIPELNCKAVALPYKGDRLNMIILLPNEIEGLKDMQTKLQNFSLASIPYSLHKTKIDLSLPKFTLESTIDLKDPLKAVGAGIIFDQDKSDFSGISSDGRLYVSKAIQKVFIEVNEEGSEGAAASGIQMRARSMFAFSSPQFTANHPFFFLIVEDKTFSILFVSTISNPTQTRIQLKIRDDINISTAHLDLTLHTAISMSFPSLVIGLPLASLLMIGLYVILDRRSIF